MSQDDLDLEAFLAQYLGPAEDPPPPPWRRVPRRRRRGHVTIISLQGGPHGLFAPYDRRRKP